MEQQHKGFDIPGYKAMRVRMPRIQAEAMEGQKLIKEITLRLSVKAGAPLAFREKIQELFLEFYALEQEWERGLARTGEDFLDDPATFSVSTVEIASAPQTGKSIALPTPAETEQNDLRKAMRLAYAHDWEVVPISGDHPYWAERAEAEAQHERECSGPEGPARGPDGDVSTVALRG